MDTIPMTARGRRPRFFPAPGTDELVSVVLELASELWTVKERLYAVERAAESQGLDIRDRVEGWRFDGEDRQRLEAERRRFLDTLLRGFDAEYVERRVLQAELDRAMHAGAPPPVARDGRPEAA